MKSKTIVTHSNIAKIYRIWYSWVLLEEYTRGITLYNLGVIEKYWSKIHFDHLII